VAPSIESATLVIASNGRLTVRLTLSKSTGLFLVVSLLPFYM
jgi:hypothetical protein